MPRLSILALAVLGAPLIAQDHSPTHQPSTEAPRTTVEVSTGLDFEEGDYGIDQTVRKLSVPATVRMTSGRLQLATTLPYARLEAPANVVSGSGLFGLPIIIDPTQPRGESTRREGIGDMTVSASYGLPTGVVDLSLSGQAKLPTAEAGLGTGKTDYAIGAEASKAIAGFTPFVGVGYTMPGSPEGYALRNSLSVRAGVAANLAPRTRGFVSYGQAQNVSEGLPDEQQVTAGVNTGISDSLSLGVYGAAGLTQGSADVGAGIRLGIRIR